MVTSGVLRTSGSNAVIGAEYGSGAIVGASVAADSLVGAGVSGTLTFDGGTIGGGAALGATDGGIVYLSGSVTNSGTLYAAFGGLIDITSGALVSGGSALIGTGGEVEVDGPSGEKVAFQSGALNAGLLLTDEFSPATANTFSGSVVGFGGSNGEDTSEYIDLTNVMSSSEVSATFVADVSNPTSGGVLEVTSAGTLVADINLIGNYTHADFVISAGITTSCGPSVEIIDPAAGGVSNLALLTNYIAAGFAAASAGLGGVFTPPLEEPPQALTHPHHR